MNSMHTETHGNLATDARPRRRGRAARNARLGALELAALAVVAVLLVVGTFSSATRAPSGALERSVSVTSGDTLWSIATSHPIPGLDTAHTAEAIRRANDLRDSSLDIGQTLMVPGEGSSEPQVASR